MKDLKSILISAFILISGLFSNAQDKNIVPEGSTGIILSNEAHAGFLIIQQVIPGSPADKAGIKPGEAVMKVDTDVSWLKWPEYVYNELEGKPGTSVEIMLWKNDHNYSVTLIREVINNPPPPLDTVNHKPLLPTVKLDTAFCNSFGRIFDQAPDSFKKIHDRSEERRVGKECRSRWSPYH